MGTSRSVPEFTAKLDRAVRELTDNKPAVTAAAQVTKTIFLSSLRASGVSGSTKVSKAVKARYDIKGTRNPTALIRYTGPAHLLNNPTKAHSIVSRKNRGTRASRGARESGVGTKGVILVAGQPKAYASHPGTRGLGFFQRAVPVAARAAPIAYFEVGVVKPLTKVFR